MYIEVKVEELESNFIDELKKQLFEQLYNTYYDSVYRYIFKLVKNKFNTEDIISNVFINIYRHRDKIIDIEKSKPWVFRIAHNSIIDFYRKNAKVIPVEEVFEQGCIEIGYEHVIIKEQFIEIKKIIEQFPEKTKEMLYMRYYGDLKFREIAEILSIPENTVKSKVSRTISKIKRMISEEVENDEKIYKISN